MLVEISLSKLLHNRSASFGQELQIPYTSLGPSIGGYA